MPISRSLHLSVGSNECTASAGNINCSTDYGNEGGPHFTNRADVDEFIAMLREAADYSFPPEQPAQP